MQSAAYSLAPNVTTYVGSILFYLYDKAKLDKTNWSSAAMHATLSGWMGVVKHVVITVTDSRSYVQN